jgi:hypothetical protein
MRFSSHFKFSYIYISRFFFNYYIIIVSTMPTFFFITMHYVHLPFNAAKCIVYMTKQIRIILLILDRQSKSLLANLGRILLFHFFFWKKTGIRDLRQVKGFLQVLQFSPPIKLTDILLKGALNTINHLP